ncbi:MAG: NitT/TauT family transport system permease protein [Hyphomicrobiales bacterium]|nr:NitT/TauT family transport system permease protein [Hyphomicrobiales bacterium]
MTRSLLNRSLPAIGLVAFLLAWEAAPLLGLAQRSLVPLPSELPAAFLREVKSGIWQTSVWLSLSHYTMGLFVGAGAGVGLGIVTGMSGVAEGLLAWVNRVLRPIPGLAWVPFAIIWFGVNQSGAVFIISVGVFWIVYFATHGAIRSVDRDLIEVAKAFGFASAPERLIKVLLPAATPGILVGLRTALGQAWMAVVAAELFGVTGLGSRMMQASSLLATDIVVVYMLTMAALYGLMDALFMFAQGRLLQWKP